MANTTNNNRNGAIIIGFIFIVLGGLFLVNEFNIINIDFKYYIFSWRSLLMIVGLFLLSSSNSRVTGLIFIGVGLSFWILEVNGVVVNFWKVFWPLLLIIVGLSLILRSHKNRVVGNVNNDFLADTSVNEDFLDFDTVFSQNSKEIISTNFKGGKISTVFGSLTIDLRKAEPAPNGAFLECDVVFGNVTIIVPDDWTLKTKNETVLGAFNDKRFTSQVPNPEKVLNMKGDIVFANLEIKSL